MPIASAKQHIERVAMNQHISQEQKYKHNHSCPICGQREAGPLPHCHGFRADNENFCYCTSEDHANGALLNTKCVPESYTHILENGTWRPFTEAPPVRDYNVNGKVIRLLPKPATGPVSATVEVVTTEPKAKAHVVEPGTRYFHYTDNQRVIRTDKPGAEKYVRPQHRVGDDWLINDGPGEIEYIYHRAEIAEQKTGTLHVFEGETCCEAARAIGLPAFTWRGGCGRVGQALPQIIEICKDRNVVLHTDADVPGRKAMRQIAEVIHGVAESVKIFDIFPDENPIGGGRDIQDWLAEGGERDALDALIIEAPEYEPIVEPVDAPRVYATYTPRQMKERPAITFAVENLIPSGGFVSLVGAPGTYKSFIALDIAASIAKRGYWQGRDTARGAVLYVSAEGMSGMGQRIGAWETARDIEIPDTFRTMTDAPQLRDGECVAALIATVKAVQAETGLPVVLTVIDTFARTFNGEENSSKEVGEAIEAADLLRRETGSAVLIVHHLNKAGTGSRGSSALLGALDAEITVTRTDHTVKMEVTKAKDFGEGEPILLAARVVQLEGGGSSLTLVTHPRHGTAERRRHEDRTQERRTHPARSVQRTRSSKHRLEEDVLRGAELSQPNLQSGTH
ncbi:MAG: AAA family ATPase [Chloroflexota bacterium]|nr:AAA family ATPase [Chloroflexota bacterium]